MDFLIDIQETFSGVQVELQTCRDGFPTCKKRCMVRTKEDVKHVAGYMAQLVAEEFYKKSGRI